MPNPSPDPHVDPQTLRRLVERRLPAAVGRRVLAHLVGGCAACAAMARGRFGVETAALTIGDEPARRRAQGLRVERLLAAGRAARLDERLAAAATAELGAEVTGPWGLPERLVGLGREAIRAGRPARAVELARLAVAAAERPDQRRPAELVADLRTRAWGALGNAHRNRAEPLAARCALARAWRYLAGGTGDPLEEARLLVHQASLDSDLGRRQEAAAGLERAMALYRRVGQHRDAARVMVDCAILTGRSDPAAGIRALAAAEADVDAMATPRLLLRARQHRAGFLADAGRCHEALELLEDCEPLGREIGDPWSRLRQRRTEARAAAGLGLLATAQALLEALWTELFARDLRRELVLVTLDLVAVHLRRGDAAAARRRAAALLPLLRAWQVADRITATWLVLGHQIARGTTPAALAKTADRLRRGWQAG